MPLQYIPLNISKCCEKYNIPNNKYINKYIYEQFIELIETTFCPFELIKGKNKKNICGNKIKNGDKYCKRHNKVTIKDNNREKYYCNSKSYRRNMCGRLVKKPNELCCFHKKNNKINIENEEKNNPNQFNISNLSIVEFDHLNNKKEYNKIIPSKYKRNKKKTKCVFLDNLNNFNKQIDLKMYEIFDDFYQYEKINYDYDYKNRNIKCILLDDFDKKLGTKSYFHYIHKRYNTNIVEIPKNLEKKNMQIILYKDNNLDSFNSYMNIRYKKYLKNKKKNEKKKSKKKSIIETPEIKTENKIIEKVDYKKNELNLKKIKGFLAEKIYENKNNVNNLEKLKLIFNFIDSIKYNKYLEFYCHLIAANINNLLNLSNVSNTPLSKFKYKNVIIFNRNKDMNLKKILLDIDFEINEIPQKTISWLGNNNGLYDYTKKYNIDLNESGIKIYKKEDKFKKHILNIDQLIVFYCYH